MRGNNCWFTTCSFFAERFSCLQILLTEYQFSFYYKLLLFTICAANTVQTHCITVNKTTIDIYFKLKQQNPVYGHASHSCETIAIHFILPQQKTIFTGDPLNVYIRFAGYDSYSNSRRILATLWRHDPAHFGRSIPENIPIGHFSNRLLNILGPWGFQRLWSMLL